ncbi:hypothetical protein GCM10009304_35550 [Pseudomonas matsuisoli]|uniref:Uncharacterized protein n=1 Tax=Pseudomonas matsuisoli TaxID=1515666 RepID=A0A917Q1V8_9PSED|nr:hypothetical protein GCM10009304_35550 [Pseudomonas matsuisoli]
MSRKVESVHAQPGNQKHEATVRINREPIKNAEIRSDAKLKRSNAGKYEILKKYAKKIKNPKKIGDRWIKGVLISFKI